MCISCIKSNTALSLIRFTQHSKVMYKEISLITVIIEESDT